MFYISMEKKLTVPTFPAFLIYESTFTVTIQKCFIVVVLQCIWLSNIEINYFVIENKYIWNKKSEFCILKY